jgi:arylsulfatase A-like enzyme
VLVAASAACFLAELGCGGSERAAVWKDLAADHEFAEAFFAPEYRLDGRDPAQVAYLDDRWSGAQPGGQGLLSTGPVAAFDLPLVSMPVAVTVSLLPEWETPAGRREVTLRLNGAPLASFFAPATARQRLDVPAALVRTGANRLEIDCQGARSFRVFDLLVQPRPADTPAPRLEKGSWVDRTGGKARILQIPGAQLSYYLRSPGLATLRFDLPSASGAPANYSVRMQRRRGAPETIFTGKSGDGEVEVPLTQPEGTLLRISFEVARRAGSRGRGPAAYAWGAPGIFRAPRVGSQRSTRKTLGDRQAARKLPNVVIYVIDALRADHLEAYGYDRPTSPEITRFAREAAVFEHAYTQSVWTKPCVGSLLTGLLPSEHRAVNDVAHLSESVKLLSSYLRPLGYTSIGLQANGNAGQYFGFARDFDVFLTLGRPRVAAGPGAKGRRAGPPQHVEPGSEWGSRSSETVLRRLVELGGRLKPPFFVFIQTIDPHDPYDPPAEYRDPADRSFPGLSPKEALTRFLLLPPDALASADAGRLREHLENLYDGEIRHNDHYFGQTLSFLRDRGHYDDSIIALTADHGEAFRGHGYDGYHSAFYENTIRVPLIVKPPFSRNGLRVQAPVQHLDIVPTMLQLAGLTAPGLPGRSLLSVAGGDDDAPPPTVHAARYRDLEIARFRTEGQAVVAWPWKLIQNDLWAPRYEIYNLRKDPLERTNLWPGADPVLRGFLRQETRRAPLRLRETYGGGAKLTPQAEEALRALGYVE